jgi:sulfide:quinone oxidoreductase
VDADAQAAHASDGTALPYDALLLAVGARSAPPLAHVTTFDDARADETYLGIVQDIEEGYNKRLAIVVPEGPTWPFPAYELALQTADRAYAAGFDDLDITLVTPEDKPVQVFGERASAVVEEMLSGVGVRVITGSRAEVPANRRLVAHPSGEELEPELIVALPRLEGPGIRGLPSGHGGFAPIDEGCRIVGAEEHVFAAGDVTDFPVKQGGIGAQQADVAAAGIAALAGDHEREVLAPVLRGALIAGERRRLYLQCRLEGGRPVDSEVLDEPPWEADEKVVAQELGPFLHTLEPRR